MTLGVTADEIECGLTEKGGTAKFGYLLDANSAELVSRNRLESDRDPRKLRYFPDCERNQTND